MAQTPGDVANGPLVRASLKIRAERALQTLRLLGIAPPQSGPAGRPPSLRVLRARVADLELQAAFAHRASIEARGNAPIAADVLGLDGESDAYKTYRRAHGEALAALAQLKAAGLVDLPPVQSARVMRRGRPPGRKADAIIAFLEKFVRARAQKAGVRIGRPSDPWKAYLNERCTRSVTPSHVAGIVEELARGLYGIDRRLDPRSLRGARRRAGTKAAR